MEKTSKFSPDQKDSVYLALASMLKSAIWSNDKELKERQSQIEILTTNELIKVVRLLKKK